MRQLDKMATVIIVALLLQLTVFSAYAVTPDGVSYQYYPDGRLHMITYANGTVITYVYDSAGNRQTVTTTCSGSGC